MNANGQLRSIEELTLTPRQHLKPCADCPWRRKSLAGWLGGLSVVQWITGAHSEERINCHTTQWQCAGAAIYRANVAKQCRDPDNLALPKDRTHVFATPAEFKEHHERRPSTSS